MSMTTEEFHTLFEQTFNVQTNSELRREDYGKAKALIGVISKSTASLSDVVKLADALGLNLSISASSKPLPEPPVEKDDGKADR
ncbi:hypothetical protein [Glutamicibacter ardleyensis]|uniref:Uncharacterized protein n=1 Tax=Glutamicibacter ardleyensis TaxID=225894 RepID=A0ABQ2DFX9_9MICC|nr:hypothetical protein [Glutamicibacter ardleyensis]GGJ55842.1 hypothetical protein GCM10007173_13360 [Glutamicibacter ardleyensis]